MKNIVDSSFLKEGILNNSVLIFDVRHSLEDKDYGLKEYNKGHIPNAIFIPLETMLTGKISKHGGRHPLPDMDLFAKEINDLGVDDEIDVVIYDDGDYSAGGRLWFMLKLIGKENVYLLKNGIKGWIKEDNRLEQEKTIPSKGASLTVKFNKDIIVSMEEVRAAIANPSSNLIDSRAYERYTGLVEPLDRIGGHIPTAVNYPWFELNQKDELTTHTIEEHYSDLSKDDEIIVYCGSGITGTVNMIFLEEAGYSPKLYAGSYSDWISYEGNLVISDIKG